ncbi:hypothetical protein HYS91_01430 [Candidatus Daviesbacteria bacterium]|nr:hypothetical protein [Candidatus Daviesbacteria bacterium]
MQKGFSLVIVLIALLILAGLAYGTYSYFQQQKIKNINSFEECVKAGNPVLESYPRQCKSKDGKSFTEQLSEEEQEKLKPPVDISDWKIYTNDKWSYRISYPSNWNIYDSDADNIRFDSEQTENTFKAGVNEAPTYSIKISVIAKSADISSLEEAKKYGLEYPQCNMGSSCLPNAPKEIVKKVSNIFGEYYSVVTSSGKQQTLISIPSNPRYLIAIEPNLFLWPKEDNGLYEKIISTFKFLDQNVAEDIEANSYTACGCGCCGGVPAETQCLYKSKGDSLDEIKAEDIKTSKSESCAVMGCSRGTKYHYCD